MTVIASGGGLSPVRTTHTVSIIEGIKNTESATAIRIGNPNFPIKKNITTPTTKKIRYESIIVYTPGILVELEGHLRDARILF